MVDQRHFAEDLAGLHDLDRPPLLADLDPAALDDVGAIAAFVPPVDRCAVAKISTLLSAAAIASTSNVVSLMTVLAFVGMRRRDAGPPLLTNRDYCHSN